MRHVGLSFLFPYEACHKKVLFFLKAFSEASQRSVELPVYRAVKTSPRPACQLPDPDPTGLVDLGDTAGESRRKIGESTGFGSGAPVAVFEGKPTGHSHWAGFGWMDFIGKAKRKPWQDILWRAFRF